MSKDPIKSATGIVFDDNLRTFGQKVINIVALENGGKIEREQAYKEIKDLYKKLKRSKKNLLKDKNKDE